MSVYCPSCGVSNPEGVATCRVCGKELVSRPISDSCPSCGAVVQESQSNCTKCGAKLLRSRSTEVVPMVPRPPKPSAVAPTALEPSYKETMAVNDASLEPETAAADACPICGRSKDVAAEVCEECAQSGRENYEVTRSETVTVSDPDLPKLGGILIIIAGVLGVVYGMLSISRVTDHSLPFSVVCFTSLMMVFGLAAIFGGISAMGRLNAVYAVLGGVFGILSIGFYIGALLSFIGLVLVMKSYNEFSVRKISLDLSR